MKRSEFPENMHSMWDLHEFCVENSCGFLEYMYDSDGFSDYIDESLMDYARNDYWRDLMTRLNGYDDMLDRYEYFVDDDYDGWVGIDDSDFDHYYRDILEWVDEHDVWDPEDDEEDDGNPPFERPSEPEEEEELFDDWDDFSDPDDCSFDDLCVSGSECVSAVRNRAEREAAEADNMINELWF